VQIEQQRLEIERERIASQERQKGIDVGLKAATDAQKLAASQRSEGMRMGLDASKHEKQLAHQKEQSTNQMEHQSVQSRIQAYNQAGNKSEKKPTDQNKGE